MIKIHFCSNNRTIEGGQWAFFSAIPARFVVIERFIVDMAVTRLKQMMITRLENKIISMTRKEFLHSLRIFLSSLCFLDMSCIFCIVVGIKHDLRQQ